MLASVKMDAPKGAAKNLVSRVFPRLAAHDVPDLVTVPALTRMLADGAVAERYAVRYARYFLQRVFEHHGRADLAASHPDARDAVAALAKFAKERTGARQLLATRALVAAARAVPRRATPSKTPSPPPRHSLRGKAPRSSSSSSSSSARRSPPSSPPPPPRGRTPPPAPPSARDSDCPSTDRRPRRRRPVRPRRALRRRSNAPPRLRPRPRLRRELVILPRRVRPPPPSPPPPRPRTSSSFATRGPPRCASRRTARTTTWRR